MKLILKSISVTTILFLSACNGNNTTDVTPATKPTISQTNEIANPEDIKSFLYDKEGTYGWESKSDEISYDFFKDGRLHLQGPDGEATMWEGKWQLNGNQLTLTCDEIHKNETLLVKIDGEKLILGDKIYTRYAP